MRPKKTTENEGQHNNNTHLQACKISSAFPVIQQMINKWKLIQLFLMLWPPRSQPRSFVSDAIAVEDCGRNRTCVLSSKDAITTVSNRALQCQQTARYGRQSSWLLKHSALFRLLAKCVANSSCKCQPDIQTSSNLERIYLERKWSPPSLVDLILNCTGPALRLS